MKNLASTLYLASMLGLVSTIAACGGSDSKSTVASAASKASAMTRYSVTGTVSGLMNGTQITLQNNGTDSLNVTANGSFTFATPLAPNSSYAVTVSKQPAGQICSVANGSGTGAGMTANVTNVSIVCSPNTYSIGGTLSGLAQGAQVTLQNNANDPVTVTANGAFRFTTSVAYGGSYAVTVATQPTGQTCTIANGTGIGAGIIANVTNVSIVCSANSYTIGGTISGLANGAQITLQNNATDSLMITENGRFTFPAPVAHGSSYAVTVGTQPTGQVCTAASGPVVGTNIAANVSNINIVCSTNIYAIGGTVSGLADGTQVTLQNNAANPLTITANGTFTFTTPVAYGGSYAVTVATQPLWQSCLITNGNGTVTTNVSNVTLKCVDQPAQVSTFAGSTTSGSADGMGTAASFYNPTGIATDANGNFYVTDSLNKLIRKITPAGLVSTLAGSDASFSYPQGIAVDTNNNLYVADPSDHKIYKITSTGAVSTLAGSGKPGSVDATGTAASFNYPQSVAVDTNGNVYVADSGNHKIRKITPAGVVSTLAGSGTFGFVDATGTDASFSYPQGVAVDANGNVYVADYGNHKIRKITSAGVVSTLAGSGTPGAINATGIAASFNNPGGVAVDTRGNVYVADTNNHQIRKITPAGVVSTLAGAGATTFGATNGIGSAALFHYPYSITIDANGNLYVADFDNNQIRKLTPAP